MTQSSWYISGSLNAGEFWPAFIRSNYILSGMP